MRTTEYETLKFAKADRISARRVRMGIHMPSDGSPIAAQFEQMPVGHRNYVFNSITDITDNVMSPRSMGDIINDTDGEFGMKT